MKILKLFLISLLTAFLLCSLALAANGQKMLATITLPDDQVLKVKVLDNVILAYGIEFDQYNNYDLNRLKEVLREEGHFFQYPTRIEVYPKTWNREKLFAKLQKLFNEMMECDFTITKIIQR